MSMEEERKALRRQIAKAYDLPIWLIDPNVKPRWWSRLYWRIKERIGHEET